MVRHLPWKVKVVRSVTALTGMMMLSCLVYAQSIGDKKISISFPSAPLENVMQEMTRLSGVSFVYSTNKININKRVSLNERNKTVHEVLMALGHQSGLNFRLEGHHVTIKEAEPMIAHVPKVVSKMERIIPEIDQKVESRASSVTYFFDPVAPPASGLLNHDRNLQREFKRLQPYFDSTFLKRVPAQYVKRLNSKNTHPSWFLSFGPMMNDYSSGFEIQAGIRSAYVVFTPSWMRNSRYHSAYGVGSSVNLTHNFAITPVYLYGTTGNSESYFMMGNYAVPSQIVIQNKAKHHQLKLMLRYAAKPGLMVKVGPTFNHTFNSYSYRETSMLVMEIVREPYQGEAGVIKSTSVYHAGKVVRANTLASDYQSTDFWIGWEASVSARINFFQGR